VPPPERADPRGSRVRGVAHPRGDDRGGGRAARSGRDQHALLRLAGDGTHRRGHLAHLADRAQDEGPARRAPRRRPRRQRAGQALRGQVHDQSRHRPRHLTRGGLDRGRQARRSRALEARLLRGEAGDGAQGRAHRGGRDGRPQRVDSHSSAGAVSPHVRLVRGRGAVDLDHVPLAGRGGGWGRGAARPAQDDRRGPRLPGPRQVGDDPQRLLPAHGSGRGDVRGAGRRPAPHLRAGPRATDGPALLPLLAMVVITEPPGTIDRAALAGKTRDTLRLTWEERCWTRKRAITTEGREIALALPTGTVLEPGQILAVEGDWYLAV